MWDEWRSGGWAEIEPGKWYEICDGDNPCSFYRLKPVGIVEYVDVEGTDLKFQVERLGYTCYQAFHSPLARDVDPSLLVEPPRSATPQGSTRMTESHGV